MSKKRISESELRRGYYTVVHWIESGMRTPANIEFTEGDLRLAAQLCEHLRERLQGGDWK